MKEVEEIRRTATTVGFFASAGVLALNEVCRLSIRAPLFKLSMLSVPLVLIAPTMIARYAYNNQIDDRVDNLWRIHRNREDAGMGGTYTPTRIDNGSQHY